MTRISVVVPIYNVEPYLERCIQSIVKQTYSDLEIILVNDGSPDKCGQICDDYAKTDNRIKVIHKANGGLSDARNAGIDIATGEYIGFIDSDDFIHPQMYEILFQKINDYHADISICKYKVTEEGTIDSISTDEKIVTYTNTAALQELFTFKAPDFILAWNKLYRKDLFRNVRYPKGKIREDEFTTYKLLYASAKIVYTHTPLYYYYQSNSSIMRSSTAIKEYHYAEAMEERLSFFQKHALDQYYTISLLHYTLWLLQINFSQKHLFKNNPAMKLEFNQKRTNNLHKIITTKSLTTRTRSFYLLAIYFPSLTGIIAFHKLNRYNLISRLFDFIFAESSLYQP